MEHTDFNAIEIMCLREAKAPRLEVRMCLRQAQAPSVVINNTVIERSRNHREE